MRRVIAAGLGGLLLGVATSPGNAQEAPRTAVYTMRYASSDGGARQDFVENVIAARISLLRSAIAGRNNRAYYAHIRNVKLQTKRNESAGSDAAMLQRWRGWRALAIMSGTVQPFEGDRRALIATSSIYIGDLDPGQRSFEVLKTDLLAQNHAEITDSHSFVTGYALLLDAQRNGAGREVIASILATLDNIYAKLRGSGYLSPNLARVKQSIDRIGQTLRQRP